MMDTGLGPPVQYRPLWAFALVRLDPMIRVRKIRESGVSTTGEGPPSGHLARCNGSIKSPTGGRGTCGYHVLHREVPVGLSAIAIEEFHQFIGR
jgi:hypothetical protein